MTTPLQRRPPMISDMRAGLPILNFEMATALDDGLSAATRTSKGIWLKLARIGAATIGYHV